MSSITRSLTLISIVVVVTIVFPSQISCTSTGAGACFSTSYDSDLANFISIHGDQKYGSGSNGGFQLQIQGGATSYIPGCTYTISMCGLATSNTLNGFLLYSQQGTGANIVRTGAFTPNSNIASQVSNLNQCGGQAGSTITHSNPTPKGPTLDFTWTAPKEITGDINIGYFIVRTSQPDWYSGTLTLHQDSPTKSCPSVVSSACSAPCEDMNGMSGMCPSSDYGGFNQGPFSSSASSTSSPNHSNSMHMNMDMSMHMNTVFTTNWKGLTLVFPGWTVNDTQAYVGTLIAIFFFSLFLELMTVFQTKLETEFMSHNRKIAQQINMMMMANDNNKGDEKKMAKENGTNDTPTPHNSKEEEDDIEKACCNSTQSTPSPTSTTIPISSMTHSVSNSNNNNGSDSNNRSNTVSSQTINNCCSGNAIDNKDCVNISSKGITVYLDTENSGFPPCDQWQPSSQSSGHCHDEDENGDVEKGRERQYSYSNPISYSQASLAAAALLSWLVNMTSCQCDDYSSFNTRQHFVRTVLYVLRGFMAYVMMLIFMSLDVGATLAILGGMATGFFLFAQRVKTLSSHH